MSQNPYYKIVLIGDSGVGKSSLLERVCHDQFSEEYHIKIGVDFKFKIFQIDGKQVKLQLWDIARSENFFSITPVYYRRADGIIIVYDVSNEVSFNNIQFWVNEMKKQASSDVQVMLIGNKSEIENKQVSTKTAYYYALLNQMEFFEVSAKTSNSVVQAFLSLARTIINKKKANDAIILAEYMLNSNHQGYKNQALPFNKIAKKKYKNRCF